MPDWKAYLRQRLDTRALPPEDAHAILEELSQHLTQLYDDAIAAGASEDAAVAAAAAHVPETAALAASVARPARVVAVPEPEPLPHQRLLRSLASAARETRHAARLLIRTPVFAAVGIATLALGIGGTTAVFSVTHAVLMRPLPFAGGDRLAVVGQDRGGRPSTTGYATFLDWRERARTFDALAALGSWSPTLVTDSGTERLAGMRVTQGFFPMLGVRPAIGRLFTEDEDRAGDARRVVLLSDRLWRRRFGADPLIVGRSLQMNGLDYRVVGVLPPDFEPLISGHFYGPAEIWSPLGYDTSLPSACRSCRHLRVVGRIAPAATFDAARAELDTILRSLRAEYPDDYTDEGITVAAFRDELVRDIRPMLSVLMGAMVLVLGIAVANLASLLLARAASRRREFALRSALGAGRRTIVGQLLTESLLLTLTGGLAGVLAALWVTPVLVSLAPSDLPRPADAVDPVVLLFAAVITLGCGLLVGIAPAWRISRVNLSAEIKDAGRGTVGGPLRARALLVASEVALAIVLLAGAGLMLRTMSTLSRVEPGFDPSGVFTMQLSVSGAGFREDTQVLGFQRDVLQRIRAIPGVEAAALASQIPFGGNSDTYGLEIESRPGLTPGERPAPQRYAVTPGYFTTMRIPLRRGRLFDERDTSGSEPVVLLNESAARQTWPRGEAVGQRVRLGGPDAPFRTVIGIVGDVHHRELSTPPPLQIYLPQSQMTDASLTLVVRASADPAGLAASIRQHVNAAAPSVPVYDIAPLEDLVARSVAERRFLTRLLAALASVALLLAFVGIYGVLAWWVAQRQPEMAVRVALGARPGQIVALVLRHGLTIVAAGIVVGVPAALALTRILESQLFGVRAADPVTFAGIVMVVLGAAALANLLPATRAARVDPLRLLRSE